MILKNPKVKIFVFILICCCGLQSSAQYTEVNKLKKDSIFIPVSINTNAIIPNKLEIIPRNYYTSKFGFFCQQELKFEKATALPFKLRLGSIAEVDRMEGKPNTKFIGQ